MIEVPTVDPCEIEGLSLCIDSKEAVTPDGFDSVQSALSEGRVLMVARNNRIYNKGQLRCSQMAIRESAFQDGLHNIGHPDTPVGMLVRDLNKKGEPRISLVVLNGHHRTGLAIINRKPFTIEIVASLDEQLDSFTQGANYDFTQPETLLKLGIKESPQYLKNTWGFNTIVSLLRDRLAHLT